MLAVMLEVPRTNLDWQRWGMHNMQQIRQINQAILNQYNVNLPEYPLWPVPDPKNYGDFLYYLEWLEESHFNFNSQLGLQGVDLESMNPMDPRQLEAWVYLNWLELSAASSALKI